MNASVPSASLKNYLTEELFKKKFNLNQEFKTKIKFQGLVSYIYYPCQEEFPYVGHAELEIEGRSWTVMADICHARSLSKMIHSSKYGQGFPFFRFTISVTPDQLRNLTDKMVTTRVGTCSMGVLKNLSIHGKYEVPIFVTVFPLSSSIYLATAKLLGSRRISRIEFYGGQNSLINLTKSIRGAAKEALGIGTGLYLVFLGVCTLAKAIHTMVFFSE